MNDTTLRVLKEFRASVPEPDAGQRERAFAQALLGVQVRRRRRSVALILAGVGVGVAVTVFLLVGTRASGPTSLDAAQAAAVIRHVVSANAPNAGSIFYARYQVTAVPWAGARRFVRATNEVWREPSGAQRYRIVDRFLLAPTTIEVGGALTGCRLSVFDPRTKTIYRTSNCPFANELWARAGAFDVAARLRARLGRAIADVWTVKRTSLRGRAVYRISSNEPSPAGPTGTTYYVDAMTYVPIQIEQPGPPFKQPGFRPTEPGETSVAYGKSYPRSLTVVRVFAYQHLPRTSQQLARLDLSSQHTGAPSAPTNKMRADLALRLFGPRTPAPGPPTGPAPQPSQTKRFIVDVARGSLVGFRIGDPASALIHHTGMTLSTTYSTGPTSNFGIAATTSNDTVPGLLLAHFRDAGTQHSIFLYFSGPFRTARGDVNSFGSAAKGTPLNDFVRHWPTHRKLRNVRSTYGKGTFTRVRVGRVVFFFGPDRRLSALQLGTGNAAPFVGL